MVGNYAWYLKTGNFPTDIMDVPMHLATSIDNFTVPLITLVTWITFITMGLFGLHYVRRHYFELFYYSHHLTYTLLIPAVLWHAAAGWEFLLPGVALWFVDRCMRAYRSASAATVLSATAYDAGLAGDIVTLSVRVAFDYNPGQYVFINVAHISLFEWHPFTIAGSDRGVVTLHIKTMGSPGSFTRQLHALVAAGVPLTVSVDGPYGLPLEYTKAHKNEQEKQKAKSKAKQGNKRRGREKGREIG
jgi:predicted ferric reductase